MPGGNGTVCTVAYCCLIILLSIIWFAGSLFTCIRCPFFLLGSSSNLRGGSCRLRYRYRYRYRFRVRFRFR